MSEAEREIVIEACPNKARAQFGGQIIAESDRALVLHEDGYPPRVYFPKSDVRMAFSQESDHSTHCRHKGDAAYWTFSVGDKILENVAWGYPDPMPSVILIAGHISFAEPVKIEA